MLDIDDLPEDLRSSAALVEIAKQRAMESIVVADGAIEAYIKLTQRHVRLELKSRGIFGRKDVEAVCDFQDSQGEIVKVGEVTFSRWSFSFQIDITRRKKNGGWYKHPGTYGIGIVNQLRPLDGTSKDASD
jgi:hypothetical protein